MLYITHPNGYVTVYAHQKKFADKIDVYVKRKQNEQKKNEIELYLTQNELPIKKGEVIGYTGNSGSSTAPHLHFEIREEKSEVPINPLLVYPIKDDIKPMLNQIAFYNTVDTSNIGLIQAEPIKNNKEGGLVLSKSIITLPHNLFAIAFSGYDMSNGSNNKNNIYDAKLKLDNQLIYHHQLNNISFDYGRYVNYFSEKINGQKMQKCFTPTCYDIAIYKTIVNGGKIVLSDTLPHNIELIVTDERGNTNAISFKIKAKEIKNYNANTNTYNAFCNKEFTLKKEDVELTMPSGSLIKNSLIGIYYNQLGKLTIGNKNDLLLKAYALKVKIYNVLKGKEKKMILTYGDDNCLIGKYENGWFNTESKTLGSFKVSYDTTAPSINYLQAKISNKKGSASKKKKQPQLPNKSTLKFKVSDNLSGIGDYHLYINNVWQIAEYDTKTATITYYVEPAQQNEKLNFKLEVYDRVGNLKTYYSQ